MTIGFSGITPTLDHVFNISDHRLQVLEIKMGRQERRRIINFRATVRSEAITRINREIESTDWGEMFANIEINSIIDSNSRIMIR